MVSQDFFRKIAKPCHINNLHFVKSVIHSEVCKYRRTNFLSNLFISAFGSFVFARRNPVVLLELTAEMVRIAVPQLVGDLRRGFVCRLKQFRCFPHLDLQDKYRGRLIEQTFHVQIQLCTAHVHVLCQIVDRQIRIVQVTVYVVRDRKDEAFVGAVHLPGRNPRAPRRPAVKN